MNKQIHRTHSLSHAFKSLTASGMNFDLSRMKRVMAELGHPQDIFPSIHIAGTNGKGSVASMIATVLKRHGYKTGLYTSPHLSDVRERFQINGRLIPKREFRRMLGLIRSVLAKTSLGIPKLTEFELLTAVGFLWFGLSQVDVAVIEVGLGGRLDATNILKNVLVSVITSIDLDHTQWLGSTKKAIALEKAGIIKPGCPVIAAVQGEARKAIRARAIALGSPLHLVSSRSPQANVLVPLYLNGPHQKSNARVSYEALNILKPKSFHLENWGIIEGIRKTKWPGRFETFRWPTGRGKKTVILDGAHNPAAVRVLLQTLKEKGYSKVHLLFGVLKDKDYRTMARMLAKTTDSVTLVPVDSIRTENPRKLAGLKYWTSKPNIRSAREGFKNLLELADDRTVLVTGSLYLVGEIRPLVLRRDS